ncbi:hypothetical protein TRFO_07003 [Tritrichomonas foetus]|uniref:Uncharacterized protein n=1 Tax=Tritrichomonas foetus TaxID=1144522 RepID=A0A1J4JUC1_9EUKA|nr:hypothetical protein TRFO_07003 [Tritrichomonas foetus]|eukprot:OHT02595.1 hypothetical protein TRFO_07003 [Tritrichomonas foetus]
MLKNNLRIDTPRRNHLQEKAQQQHSFIVEEEEEEEINDDLVELNVQNRDFHDKFTKAYNNFENDRDAQQNLKARNINLAKHFDFNEINQQFTSFF